MLAPLLALLTLAPLPPAQNTELREAAREIVDERRRRIAVETLQAEVDALREEHHVPGLAVVVLAERGVLTTLTSGTAEAGVDAPVDADTVFPVGALTEAWTALLVGLLAEEGALAWDDPVDAWLPELAPPEGAPPAPTLLELVSHTSGYGALPILSVGDAPPALLVEALGATRRSPSGDFVESAPAFAAVGEVVGRRLDSSWAAEVHQRLVQPLGLRDTLASPARDAGDRREARGHVWIEEAGAWEPRARLEARSVAAARGLRTSAADLARLLGVLLDRGRLDGERLLPPAVVADAGRPVARTDEGDGRFGRGWFVRTWRGRRLVERRGTPPGFLAQAAWLPDDGAGLAVLGNAQTDTLFEPLLEAFGAAVLPLAADRLSEVVGTEPPATDGARPAEPAGPEPGEPRAALEQLVAGEGVGAYLGTIGSFRGVPARIQQVHDRLFCQLPGRARIELRPGEGDGVWLARDGLPARFLFQRDAEGAVCGFTLEVLAYSFRFDRLGWAVYDVAVEPYLGTYRHASGAAARVLPLAGGLGLELPATAPLPLRADDGPDAWKLPGARGLRVRFERDAGGAVGSLALVDGEEVRVLERVRGPEPRSTIEATEPAERGRALESAGRLHLRGRATWHDAGLEGAVHAWVEGHDRWRMDVTLGRFGTHRVALDGDSGWLEWAGATRPLSAAELRAARSAHPLALLCDWRRLYPWVQALPPLQVQDLALGRYRLRQRELSPAEVTVRADTREVVRSEVPALAPDGGVLRQVRAYGDWRRHGELRVPFLVRSEDPWRGRVDLVWEVVEPAPGGADPFELPTAPPRVSPAAEPAPPATPVDDASEPG